MNKKLLLNLFLFMTVLLLAAVIFYSEEDNNTLPRISDLNKNIDINAINSITIQHNNNNTVINRNSDGHWQITQPINIAANDFRINSILKLLNAPVHKHYPFELIGSKKFGYTGTSIKFNDQTISFGITNPATKFRYVRLNDTVYTIEDVYSPLVTSHFSTLVSLNLLPADSRIKKLELINFTIDKDKKGRWQSSIDSSADQVSEILDAWLHTQAFGLHANMQGNEIDRNETGEITIYLEDNTTIKYVVTDTDPWLILARPEIGLEYHLDAEVYDRLLSLEQ